MSVDFLGRLFFKVCGRAVFFGAGFVLYVGVVGAESVPAVLPSTDAEGKKPSEMADSRRVDYVDGLAVDLLVMDASDVARPKGEKPVELFVGRVPRVSPLSRRASSGAFGLLPSGVSRRVSDPQLEGVPPSAQSRLVALMAAEEWEEAYVMVEGIVKANPGQTNLIQQAAVLASLCHRFEDANRYYSQYVKRSPRDAATMSAWSSVLIYMGRYGQARTIAERALAVQPQNLHARLMTLCIDLAQSKEVPANQVSFWRKRALVDQATVGGWLSGDSDKFRLGLSDRAWHRLCEITLGFGTHENLAIIPSTIQSAVAEMAEERWVRALVYFDLGKEYGLDGVEFRQSMAHCFYEVGNKVDALKIMHGLTLEYPTSANVWYNYGYILISFEVYDEASIAFRQAHDLAPESGQTYFALACAYVGMGEEGLAWGILDFLGATQPEHMAQWIEGDQSYLRKIRGHARYADLMEQVKMNLK